MKERPILARERYTQQCGHPLSGIVWADDGTQWCEMCRLEGEIERLQKALASEQALNAMMCEDIKTLVRWVPAESA